jgi:hypothetical protein
MLLLDLMRDDNCRLAVDRRRHVRHMTVVQALKVVCVPLNARAVRVRAVFEVHWRRRRAVGAEATFREEAHKEGAESREAGADDADAGGGGVSGVYI